MKLLDKNGLEHYTSKVKETLTNYVQNTDYATNSKGGVIKIGSNAISINGGFLVADTRTYSNYINAGNVLFISKGTLENVITGKQLVNQTYVDNIVGDINTALDTINGEVI